MRGQGVISNNPKRKFTSVFFSFSSFSAINNLPPKFLLPPTIPSTMSFQIFPPTMSFQNYLYYIPSTICLQIFTSTKNQRPLALCMYVCIKSKLFIEMQVSFFFIFCQPRSLLPNTSWQMWPQFSHAYRQGKIQPFCCLEKF